MSRINPLFEQILKPFAPPPADRVKRIRDEIQAGTYETPEKLDTAIVKAMPDIMRAESESENG